LLLAAIAAAMLILACAGSAVAEVTGAADNLRTGWYPDEPSLTPALLGGASFQEAFKTPLKGQIYAQPLTANGTLLVATEDNWVYGLDPDSGAVRWERQFGTPVNSTEKEVECTDLQPHIGITGTPVIDTERDIAYFVSNRYVSSSPGPVAWYMHAIELGSGEEVANFPVKIEGEAQNIPGVKFNAPRQLQRPALLMMNGVVYAGFGSHCDNQPYEGWIAGVSTSGELQSMWATASNGGSIWQAGGGLVSDGPGQILFSTGNGNEQPKEDPPPGPGGASTPSSGLGQSVVRVEARSGGILKSTDFFSPFENLTEDEGDLDLGSSAPIALPSQYFGTPGTPHLLVQSGKTGYVYLLNRDNLGGMGQGPSGSDRVLQRLGPYGGVWDGAAVWPGDGGYAYIPSVEIGSDRLRFFKYGVDEKTGQPALSLAASSPDSPAFGSGSPIVTSNGAANGTALLWTTWCSESSCKAADLRAYSAVPSKGAPQLLWERPIGTASKFSRPDASNGHVYVGNREGDIFGFSGPAGKPPPPAVTTGAASSLTQDSATLNGIVNPNGGNLDDCKFEYGTSRSYSSSVPCTPSPGAGSTAVAVSASLAGLSANATYYFRIVAASPGGRTYGVDQALITLAATPPHGPVLAAPGTSLETSPGQGALPFQEHKAPLPEAELASTSLRVSRSGTLSIKVSCPAGESRCAGTVTLRTLHAVSTSERHGSKRWKRVILTLAVGSFRVAGGKVTTVKLHLSAAARALLAREHLLRVRATIVAHDVAGTTHVSRRTVTIRLAKTRRARKR
jgi:outer membrane protein assembly factor BamB